MPEHLRALIVILFLAGMAFHIANRLAGSWVSLPDLARRRNLWFVLTLLAFLTHSFWAYAIVAAVVLAITSTREPNRVALFFSLLFLIPPASAQIPGLGLINYLVGLNHVRLLSLVVLLPAFFALRKNAGTLPFGRTWPDKLLALYLLLTIILTLRETSVTDTLRQAFYAFTDALLPYYVASRAAHNVARLKDAMCAFVVAALVLAIVGVFEISRHWLLYNAVVDALGLYQWGVDQYLGRSGLLRASASTGHSIALGYVMAVAIGFYLYLPASAHSRLYRRLGGLMLVGGLIAPLARGPWVGVVALLATYIATGRQALRRLGMMAMAGLVTLPLLAVLPGGSKLIGLLPFIGSVETGNITYREKVMENGWIVIQRNPWFGSVDFLKTPEMEALRQGQGIIDIVNTYVGVALSYGLVGLGLFVGFFAMTLIGIRKAMRTIPDKDDEMHRLGRALFATLTGILVIIFTVSSITIIPVVYWSVAGLGVAYAQMGRIRASALEHHNGLNPRKHIRGSSASS
jgi:O-antigen ligase